MSALQHAIDLVAWTDNDAAVDARAELATLRRDLESARYLYESRFKEIDALRERVAALDEAISLMHRMGADDARDEWGQRVVLPELETDIDAFLARRALTAPGAPQ